MVAPVSRWPLLFDSYSEGVDRLRTNCVYVLFPDPMESLYRVIFANRRDFPIQTRALLCRGILTRIDVGASFSGESPSLEYVYDSVDNLNMFLSSVVVSVCYQLGPCIVPP